MPVDVTPSLPDTSLFHRRPADGRRRLLVVEDQQDQLHMTATILGAAGYELLEAQDGNEALDIIRRLAAERQPLDGMLLDVQLPVLNGVELLGRLDAEGLVVPTIAMSATCDHAVLIALMRLGCDDFLGKPFTPKQLTDQVQIFLERCDRAASRRRSREERLAHERNRLRQESDRFSRDARAAGESLVRLNAQVERARAVYEDLIGLPKAAPGLELAWRNRPLAAMGGDFLGCQERLILVADVAGHDLGASLLGVMVKAFFDENRRLGLTGSEFLVRLNRQLLNGAQGQRLVTAVLLAFSPTLDEVEVVCAGHPAPVVLRANPQDPPAPEPAPGSVLGIDPDAVFSPVRFGVRPGDRILLCTDGVSDASRIGSDGRRRRFGRDGLRAAVARVSDARGSVEAGWAAALDHCRHKVHDDMLLVGIRVTDCGFEDFIPAESDFGATEAR